MRTKQMLIQAIDSIKYEPKEMNLMKIKKFQPKKYLPIIASLLILTILLSIFIPYLESNTIYGNNLMNNIIAVETPDIKLDNNYINAVTNFSIKLFQNNYEKKTNTLISPISLYLSLGMLANGADKETLTQLEDVLGQGIKLDQINAYTKSLFNRIVSDKDGSKMLINNAIWLNNNWGSVSKDFLQVNADFYKLEAFKANFNSNKDILNKVNSWIENKTDGTLKDSIKDINENDILLLINTILFDAEWENKYRSTQSGTFFTNETEGTLVEYLKGYNSYIESDDAVGFISPYKENYSFVAILPDFKITLEEYIAKLDSKSFMEFVDMNTNKKCLSLLPQFEYESNTDLVSSLKQMGLDNIFSSNSNFQKINKDFANGKTFIKELPHQTKINLDKNGTRVSTGTTVKLPTLGTESSRHYVDLNRPFLYAIIHNETKIPLLMGTVNEITGEKTTGIRPKGEYLIEDGDFIFRIYDRNDSLPSATIHKYIGKEKEVVVPMEYNGHYILEIEEYAFYGNPYIEKVTTPKSLNSIFDYAFANCENLESIYIYSNVIDSVIDTNIIEGSPHAEIHAIK